MKASSSGIAKVPRSGDPHYEQLVKVVHTLGSSVEDLSRKITMMMLELTTGLPTLPNHHIYETNCSLSRHRNPKNPSLDTEVAPHSEKKKLSASCNKTTVSAASRNHPQGFIVRPDRLPPPPSQALPSIPASESFVANSHRPRRSNVQPPLQQQQQCALPMVTTLARQQTATTKAALALEIQQEMVQCQTALSTLLSPSLDSSSLSPSSPPCQVVAPSKSMSGCSCRHLSEKKIRDGQATNRKMALATPLFIQSISPGAGYSSDRRRHDGNDKRIQSQQIGRAHV